MSSLGLVLGVEFVALSDAALRHVGGGPCRGEWLLVEVTIQPLVRLWLFARLRNQCGNQRSVKYPCGWEPLLDPTSGTEWPLDLSSGTISMVMPQVVGGRIARKRASYPASVYRYIGRGDVAELKRREARLWQARLALVDAVSKHWDDASTIAVLMAERLEIPWRKRPGENLARRILSLAYGLDEKSCTELTALLGPLPCAACSSPAHAA